MQTTYFGFVTSNNQRLSPSLVSTGGRIELALEDGFKVYIESFEKRLPIWMFFIHQAESKGGQLYLEFDDADGTISKLLSPDDFMVARIDEDIDSSQILVGFEGSQAVFSIDRNKPGSDELRQQLHGALQQHVPIKVTYDPITYGILRIDQTSGTGIPKSNSEANFVFKWDRSKLTVLTVEEANTVFKHLKSQDYISFEYAPDCCSARAEEMCNILFTKEIIRGKKNIVSAKIFNYAENGYYTLRPANLRGINWWYHAAPVVAVLKNGTIKHRVIDPSLFTGLASISAWRKLQVDVDGQCCFESSYVYWRNFERSSIWMEPDMPVRDIFKKHRNQKDLRILAGISSTTQQDLVLPEEE